MNKIFLLAPDMGSGYAFERKMKLKKINPVLHFYTIPPRVLGENINKSKKVTSEFEKALKKSFTFNLPVAIACNTLQFWLTKVDKRFLRHGKVITTFKACKNKFKDSITKPVWLGTTPTSILIKSFPSLYKLKLDDLQSKVQELIWRIKMVNGDDVSSAPLVVKKDMHRKLTQKNKIKILKKEIVEGLQKNNIRKVILGCTELPLAFKYKKAYGIRFYDPAEILAIYIKGQH